MCRFSINGKPTGNPPTRLGGMGLVRVRKSQPGPIPLCTLPKTRMGSETHDNPYSFYLCPEHIVHIILECLAVVLQMDHIDSYLATSMINPEYSAPM